MSMWQYMAAVEGYIAANNPDENRMSGKEVDDMWDWLKSKQD